MSRTLKLIWVLAVAYMLISTNFSVPVKAQSNLQSTNLSCESIPQPNAVIYHQDPFKPKKGDKSLGNAYILYVAKNLDDKDVRLEVKGLDKEWFLRSTEKEGVTNSDIKRVKDNKGKLTDEIKIAESGEYILISPEGTDAETLELKSKDNTAIINPVSDKDEIVSVVEYLKTTGLEMQGYILGLGRQEYELEAIIYDIASKLLEEEGQKSGATGEATLLITGRQAEEVLGEITNEILQDLGQFDAKQWLSTQDVSTGEPTGLLQNPQPKNIKIEAGKFVEYLDKSTTKISFGNRLSIIYAHYADGFESYLIGFISQLDDETRARALLNSAKEKVPPNARPIIAKFLDNDLKPYLKPKSTEQPTPSTLAQKKPYQPPTEEQIKERAQKISELRKRLRDLDENRIIYEINQLYEPELIHLLGHEQELITILGGLDEVDNLVKNRGLADNFKAFKEVGGTRALDFLKEEVKFRIDLYGKGRIESVLAIRGIEPSSTEAENFLRNNWDKREAELQLRLESELETFDVERYKTAIKQLREENKLLNEFRKFNERAKRIHVPLEPDNFKVFVDLRVDEIKDIRADLVQQIPDSEGLSRAMLAKMDDFSKVLEEGKSQFDSTGKLSDEFYNKVDKIFKDASSTLEDLPDKRQQDFRSFVEIADEVRQGVDSNLVNEKLNAAKEDALKAIGDEVKKTREFREKFMSKIDKQKEIALRSDVTEASLFKYESLLEKARIEIEKTGKISPGIVKEIVLQIDRQQHLQTTQSLDMKFKRDNVLGGSIANKLKKNDPALLRSVKDLELRMKHPTIARLKDNANQLWLNRQKALSATREIVDNSPNSKLFKKVSLAKKATKFAGPMGLGLIVAFSASASLKEYGEINGNIYVYRTGLAVDIVSYGVIAITIISEVFLFTGRALPIFLRAFSISIGGLGGIASLGIGIAIGVIVSKISNVILCKLSPLSATCGCSSNPFYGKAKLVLSKNTARPGEVIGFMVYGAQYCENADLKLADGLTAFSGLTITKSCVYNDAGCCIGQARVEVAPGAYNIKGDNPSTETQPFEVTGEKTFILYRASLVYNTLTCPDGVTFKYANGLDSDVLLLFYITNDKGEVLDYLPRVSPLIKAYKKEKGPIEVGQVDCLEMGIKGRVKGEFKIAWTAHKTTDFKFPTDPKPIDLSYPNEALIAKVN